MRHPIQCVHFCSATTHLYTATSNSLHAFNASTGTLLSSWTSPLSETTASSKFTTEETLGENDTDANPKKKRKVEDTASSPKPGKKEKKSDRTRLSLFAGTVSNNAISKILTTTDGKYVIIATNEDKAVTVFSVESGKLGMLSARHLPKRIVDLALVEDDTKILCADKFGDVFALPLFPPLTNAKLAPQPTPKSAPAPKPSVPSLEMAAEESGKVYESEAQRQRHLEKQRAHIVREQAAAARRKRLQVDYNISFAHDFVLGHVSMLLSLTTITLPIEHPQAAGKEKTWVLTSDRDEHIRISRYPQSFVIEGFCLGHTQFVKTMLAPSWELTTLISGGGDEYLLVWDWRAGKVREKVDLVIPVSAVLGPDVRIFVPQTGKKGEAEHEDSLFKFAVSGLWEMPSIRGVLVGVEGVPALFLFVHSSNGLQYRSTLSLPGNFLDTAVSATNNKVFVSVDPADSASPLLGEYLVSNDGEWTATNGTIARSVENCVVAAVDLSEDLMTAVRPNVLYPVGSLRKEYGIKDKEE